MVNGKIQRNWSCHYISVKLKLFMRPRFPGCIIQLVFEILMQLYLDYDVIFGWEPSKLRRGAEKKTKSRWSRSGAKSRNTEFLKSPERYIFASIIVTKHNNKKVWLFEVTNCELVCCLDWEMISGLTKSMSRPEVGVSGKSCSVCSEKYTLILCKSPGRYSSFGCLPSTEHGVGFRTTVIKFIQCLAQDIISSWPFAKQPLLWTVIFKS